MNIRVFQIFDMTLPYVSGGSMRSQRITETLTNLGVKLTVFSSPILFYEHPKDTYGTVDYFHPRVPMWDVVKKVPFFRSYCVSRALQKAIHQHWDTDCNLIHANSPAPNALGGLRAARQHNVPFLYEVRSLLEDHLVSEGQMKEGGMLYNIYRDMETNLIKKADHLTVICEGLKNDLLRRGVPEEKITIIPNGVDAETFQPAGRNQELAEQYGCANQKVVGFIGTFSQYEGLDLLIRAASVIIKETPDVKIILIGDGPHREALQSLTEELGLTSHIIFTGRVKPAEVSAYYSIIDVLVYPRVSCRITEVVTPLKPLEAMALEKFVVASDVGGLKEMVQDHETGILFRAGDHNDLTQKILWALRNPNEPDRIRKKAREYILKERTWPEICKRYFPVYQKLQST